MAAMPRFDPREYAPESSGMDAFALDRAVDLIKVREGAVAQLCVLRHGHTVLNRSVNCAPDALFLVFSAGKPLVTMLVHLLAERGALSLDDPVAKHWPEYARWHGKEPITIRHVLQHRAGVPTAARGLLGDALTMGSWDRSVRNAQRARPRWEPGAVPGYHTLTYGFILGELVRRVTGNSVLEFMDRELLAPLGMRDCFLGLPPRHWARRVPVRAAGPAGLPRSLTFNSRPVRTGVIPAANVSTTAADLARFYQALLNGGQLDGVRVLQPETVAEALRPSNRAEGELDRVLNRPVRWSQGFQLGGAQYPPDRRQPMGALSSRRAFGHNGSNICNASADPDRDLVFVYLTNRLVPRAEGAFHQAEVSDAVLSACR